MVEHSPPILTNKENATTTTITDDFTTSFLHSPPLPVHHCPLGLDELQACPFPDVVFSLPCLGAKNNNLTVTLASCNGELLLSAFQQINSAVGNPAVPRMNRALGRTLTIDLHPQQSRPTRTQTSYKFTMSFASSPSPPPSHSHCYVPPPPPSP